MKAYSREQEKLIDQTYKYNPLTGVITNVKTGGVCSSLNNGYIRVRLSRALLDGGRVGGHTLAGRLHYGKWPTMLDHKDRNPLNNKLKNLQECTSRENQENLSNQSKFGVGVYRSLEQKHKKKPFRVKVFEAPKSFSVGWFKTLEEAQIARSDFVKMLESFRLKLA